MTSFFYNCVTKWLHVIKQQENMSGDNKETSMQVFDTYHSYKYCIYLVHIMLIISEIFQLIWLWRDQRNKTAQ